MIDHPHCVRLVDLTREEDGTLLAKFPFAEATLSPDGRLSYQNPTGTVFDPVQLAANISAALEYLHKNHIVHRDVKPDNVLYEQGQGIFLLGDFGSAVVLSSSDGGYLGDSPATVAFFPPEICAVDAAPKHNGFAADIWALGLTVYCVVFGKLPFAVSTDSFVDLVDEIALFTDPTCIIKHVGEEEVAIRQVLETLLRKRQYFKTLETASS
jgi:serine/threonine protein kinase